MTTKQCSVKSRECGRRSNLVTRAARKTRGMYDGSSTESEISEEKNNSDDMDWNDMADEGLYEVEKLLAYRKVGGQDQYLVHWFGCTKKDQTWEPYWSFEQKDHWKDRMTELKKKHAQKEQFRKVYERTFKRRRSSDRSETPSASRKQDLRTSPKHVSSKPSTNRNLTPFKESQNAPSRPAKHPQKHRRSTSPKRHRSRNRSRNRSNSPRRTHPLTRTRVDGKQLNYKHRSEVPSHVPNDQWEPDPNLMFYGLRKYVHTPQGFHCPREYHGHIVGFNIPDKREIRPGGVIKCQICDEFVKKAGYRAHHQAHSNERHFIRWQDEKKGKKQRN